MLMFGVLRLWLSSRVQMLCRFFVLMFIICSLVSSRSASGSVMVLVVKRLWRLSVCVIVKWFSKMLIGRLCCWLWKFSCEVLCSVLNILFGLNLCVLKNVVIVLWLCVRLMRSMLL